MFGRMGGQQVAVTSSAGLNAGIILAQNVRGQPDVSAQATLGQHKLAVLVWHYHDDDVPGPDAAVDLQLTGLPLANGPATLTHFRIDADHSNCYEAWIRMGEPLPLTSEQYAQLETAGQLARLGDTEQIRIKDGKATIRFNLPRQGVSLLVLEWP
jgi:xylan 1,4-beta-xylosidase